MGVLSTISNIEMSSWEEQIVALLFLTLANQAVGELAPNSQNNFLEISEVTKIIETKHRKVVESGLVWLLGHQANIGRVIASEVICRV